MIADVQPMSCASNQYIRVIQRIYLVHCMLTAFLILWLLELKELRCPVVISSKL